MNTIHHAPFLNLQQQHDYRPVPVTVVALVQSQQCGSTEFAFSNIASRLALWDH